LICKNACHTSSGSHSGNGFLLDQGGKCLRQLLIAVAIMQATVQQAGRENCIVSLP